MEAAQLDKIKASLSQTDRKELCRLYEESDLNLLSSNFESLLEEFPNDPLIKLLWGHAQSIKGDIPLPFIASSLIELTYNPEINLKYPRLSFLVSTEITNNLINAGELRSAIFLSKDYISKSRPDYFETNEEFSKLKEQLLETIEKEKNQAISKREASSYLTNLEEIKKEISKSKTPKLAKLNTIPTAVKSPIIEKNNLDEDRFILGSQSTLSTIPNQSPVKDIKQSKTGYFFFAIVLIAGIVFGANISQITRYVKSINFESNSIEEKLIFESKLDNTEKPMLPNVGPFSLDSLTPSLEDINKRLAKLNNNQNKSSVSDLSQSSPTPTVDDSEVESLNQIPDKLESPANQAPVPKLPSPPANMGTPVDLGSNSKINTTNGNRPSGTTTDPKQIKQTADGRIFGPPEVVDPTNGKNNQRALDGGPLKSYEVERFDPPLVYETITATNVLSAPSLLSQPITRLNSGTPIHVTATMGLWLELRSNEGKLGYIFSQDATKK